MPDVSPSETWSEFTAEMRRAIGAEIELEFLAGCGFTIAWKRKVGSPICVFACICMPGGFGFDSVYSSAICMIQQDDAPIPSSGFEARCGIFDDY